MIAIKSKMKGKKERTIKVGYIDKVVGRWFFCLLLYQSNEPLWFFLSFLPSLIL